ncbi:hypothetical protein BDN72DRAFT_834204 [Pluteus cervinus]|uniref:Uncharacterized protein n=1 Tax=Pluteus cervinus TaxID=181527 RepID=A0ACD3B7Q3_9AGAR|nr:hypothetical protein BDN72DRAFT_834204 [Pluteus cervinus]
MECKPSSSMRTSQQTFSTDDHSDRANQNGEEILPRLPPEIEYEIFTLALKLQRKDCTRLMCVAKRVEEWLAPLIYNVLSFTSVLGKRQTLSTFERYGHHVQQILIICHIPITESDLFKYCPNIRVLGFWFDVSLNKGVFGLKSLKSLILDDLDFFQTERPSMKTDDIEKKAWFSNITHIVVTTILSRHSSTLRLFPNLTHLMLLSSNSQDILRHILRSYPTLKVVVWLLLQITSDETITVIDMNSGPAPKVDDERVVTIDCNFSEQRAKAAKGEVEEDVWVVAERTVEERRKQRPRK